MADKIHFQYEFLESFAEGVLDTRGRNGEAGVPVHYKAVRLTIRIRTSEIDRRWIDWWSLSRSTARSIV